MYRCTKTEILATLLAVIGAILLILWTASGKSVDGVFLLAALLLGSGMTMFMLMDNGSRSTSVGRIKSEDETRG